MKDQNVSDFIRPEMKARLWRWREALVGAGIALFGVWVASTTIGFVSVIGSGLGIVGALLALSGIQRARFRVGIDGAGVVQVDERQVTYFGPKDGGAVSIETLIRVELRPMLGGAHAWVLFDTAGATLFIPTNAEHADSLFDVFGVLDRFETQKMLNALNELSAQSVVIWQKERPVLH